MAVTLDDAVLTSLAEVGISGGTIYNVTGPVRQDGGAILCFVGPPHKSVVWTVLHGSGTITPVTTYTDARGRCSARFDAGAFVENVTIGVIWVP